MKEIDGVYFPLGYVDSSELVDKDSAECTSILFEKCKELLEDKKKTFPENLIKEFLKVILLRVVDTYWMQHIDDMSELRQAVRLQSYAQVNPLREYQELGFEKFETMIDNISQDATKFVNRAQIKDNLQREEVAKPTGTNSSEQGTARRQAVSNKVGRNEPCPCGSGKKYKNCCGK